MTHLLCGPSMSLVTFRWAAALALCQFLTALLCEALLDMSLGCLGGVLWPSEELRLFLLRFLVSSTQAVAISQQTEGTQLLR